MPDYTVKWPLEFNSENSGFKTVDQSNIKEVAIFNLKNILLTVPGERIMFPDFGVGIKEYLFDQSSFVNVNQLESNIRNQVNTWAPYILIENIDFNIEENSLSLAIKYSVPSAEISDVLNIEISL